MPMLASYFFKAADIFKLDPLPYDYDAMEPHIDKLTMEIHHSKHHAAYITGLNAVAAQLGSATGNGDALSLANLQANALSYGPAVRNHGGGSYNHALFWVNLASPTGSSEPSADLAAAIDDAFGSLESMKVSFKKAALDRFGSGWVWLGVRSNGKLAITSTANQDNPLMEGLEHPHEKMIPILGLDVWEHAYYLKYQNKRPDYVDSFWYIVNWNKVSRSFEKYAREGKPVPPTTTGSGHATEL